MHRQVFEELVNLGVVSHVAIENKFGIEICRKLCNAVFEPFTHIAEGQFCALLMTCLGNAVGNGTVGQHASDQYFFAS